MVKKNKISLVLNEKKGYNAEILVKKSAKGLLNNSVHILPPAIKAYIALMSKKIAHLSLSKFADLYADKLIGPDFFITDEKQL